jgi:two-component system, LytTR family, sensor kinase
MKLRQLEFWIATLLVTVSLSATLAWMGDEGQHAISQARESFWASGLRFNYVVNYFLPHILPALVYYAGFLAIMFVGFPRYYETKQLNRFISFLLVVLVVSSALFSMITYFKEPGDLQDYTAPERQAGRFVYFLYHGLLQALRFLAVMGAYLLVREFLVPQLMAQRNKNGRVQSFFTHFQVFLFIWVPVIASVFFVQRYAFGFMVFIAFCALPLAFLIHALNFTWLIPFKEQKKMPWWKYWPLYLICSFFIILPAVLIFESTIGSRSFDEGEVIAVTYAWLLILVTPFSWILYKYGGKTTGRLNQMASALSTSNATLDFLKSQINPHFLFNALNTLYGTAIQEHSERTAQGIQQLGDMMRFMLYDNMQDSIPLVKEIQYMRNYIDLQKLRTQASDKIRIDTLLDENACQHSVAPMLLIPFVENAFKHGISLIRPSWIKVSLTCTPDQVYFDVYNSVHPTPDRDPEEENSGIGLENVRQRLQLMYAGRHELTIHQSQTEYFIHLTLLFPHGKQ